MPAPRRDPLYEALRAPRATFDAHRVGELFGSTDETRVRTLSHELQAYISTNLPEAISRRNSLTDYRTNPYVLMTCGSAVDLNDPRDFAKFLVEIKLYMGLETSFGKSVESIVLGHYPIDAQNGAAWRDPQEKLAEFAALEGMSREERARARGASVWREVDRACVVGGTRYLSTVKSGPNTINDTQVNAMKDAIRDHHRIWLEASQASGAEGIDVVVGLTYGTPRTTNNKENQLLVKLLEVGFEEEDRATKPGVLIDTATGRVRVYRVVGADFWSFAAKPDDPASAPFAFLEVLLALAMALRHVSEGREVEERLNDRLQMLASAISTLRFPQGSLPAWVRDDFTDDELFWLASAMTAFFDDGI